MPCVWQKFVNLPGPSLLQYCVPWSERICRGVRPYEGASWSVSRTLSVVASRRRDADGTYLEQSSKKAMRYYLNVRTPDGSNWGSSHGYLPAIFIKKAADPLGTYTADLTAYYCGTFTSASTTFSVVRDTYDVTILLAGLPTDAATTLLVDGNKVADIKGDDVRILNYPIGASHTFGVDQYVKGLAGYRYYCRSNTWTASATASNVFNYVTQVHLDTSINPPGAGSLSLTPFSPDSWYNSGTQIQATTTGATLGLCHICHLAGYLFNEWEVDGRSVGAAQPYTIVMNSPHHLTAVFSAAGIVTKERTTSLTTETATSTEVLYTTSTSVITEIATSTTPPSAPPPAWPILAVVVSVGALTAISIVHLRRTRAARPSAGLSQLWIQ